MTIYPECGTDLAEGDQRVDLDGTVEPTKEDGEGPQENVDRIADEVSDEFDEFGESHPHSEELEGHSGLFSGPTRDTIEQEKPQEGIAEDGRWHKGGYLDGISAPWLLSDWGKGELSVPRLEIEQGMEPKLTTRCYAR